MGESGVPGQWLRIEVGSRPFEELARRIVRDFNEVDDALHADEEGEHASCILANEVAPSRFGQELASEKETVHSADSLSSYQERRHDPCADVAAGAHHQDMHWQSGRQINGKKSGMPRDQNGNSWAM